MRNFVATIAKFRTVWRRHAARACAVTGVSSNIYLKFYILLASYQLYNCANYINNLPLFSLTNSQLVLLFLTKGMK